MKIVFNRNIQFMKTKILILSSLICFCILPCFGQREPELMSYFYTDKYIGEPYKLQKIQPQWNVDEIHKWETSQWEAIQEATFQQIIENMSDTTLYFEFGGGTYHREQGISLTVPKDTAFFHTLYNINLSLKGFASAANSYFYEVSYRKATSPDTRSSMGATFYENIYDQEVTILKYNAELNIFILNLKYILNEL